MTTAEAISCGTAVIVYNATALPEIVDGNGLIVDKIDKDDILILNKNELLSRINYSRFSLNNFIDKYSNIYGMCEN